MSTLAERQTLAQKIAKVQVRVNITADPSMGRATLSGTLFGLTVAGLTIGLTCAQVVAIEHTTWQWAEENCPGKTVGPVACATCPNACQYVPLTARHWR